MRAYRIVKAGEGDYHVESRRWFLWVPMHSSPGFLTESMARDYVRRLTKPEVVAEFHTNGDEVK